MNHLKTTGDQDSPGSGNGKPHSSFKRRLLSARGATTATPKFGSQNVVATAVENDCRPDVVAELLPLILNALQKEGANTASITTDALDASSLVDRVLAEVGDLFRTPAEFEACEKRLQLILSAKRSLSTDVVAKIDDAVAKIVQPAVNDVCGKIRSLSKGSPERLKALGLETLDVLLRSKPTAEDASAKIERVTEQLERAREIEKRVAEFATDDQQVILGTLKEQARDGVRAALRALLSEKVVSHLLQKWPVLTEAAESLLSLASHLAGHIDEISRQCQRWEHQQRQLVTSPVCNTVLRLIGTSKEEAIAGVMERHRFAGRSDLVHYVVDRSLSRLREDRNEQGMPDLAALPDAQLIAAVPAAQAFRTFRDVIFKEVDPEIQTVYGRLTRHGICAALKSLVQRSRLTSDPGPRASTTFKVNAYRMVIVSLPQVTRPEDQAINARIRKKIDGKTVLITEHSADFDEVVVHRVGGGWPYQILPSNHHLLHNYLESDAASHRPHLVQILPESPRGEVSSTYKPKRPNDGKQ